MSINEKAGRLLHLADSTLALNHLAEAKTATIALGDAVFHIVGGSSEYTAVAGLVNVANDFNDSYAVVLQGLSDEIRAMAMRHLGGN